MRTKGIKKMTRSRKAAANRLYSIRLTNILNKCYEAIRVAKKGHKNELEFYVSNDKFPTWAYCNEVLRVLKEDGYVGNVSYSDSNFNKINLNWK